MATFHYNCMGMGLSGGEAEKLFRLRREKILQKTKTEASKGREINQPSPSGSCQGKEVVPKKVC
jgi:hypothetical protein